MTHHRLTDADSSRQAPLRVVTYTDAAGIGGAEISLGHLISTVSSHIQITIVGTSAKVVASINKHRPGSTSVVLPHQGILGYLEHIKIFQQIRPHLIHFNCCTPWANNLGLTTALLTSTAKIVRVDQLPLRTTNMSILWRNRALCLRVDAHVAVGQASARRMEDFYALGRDSVISIPNGVPDRGIPVMQNNLSLDSKNGIVVGSIGRLDAMKGHDILLRAVAQVEGIRAVILGEGAQRAALEQLAVELGVHDRVDLPGWITDPFTYLAKFDVVALPSRSEGFPLAMVEAMLAARPVVAARVGSIPEAIIPGKTGILIEKENVAELAVALQQLRDQPQYRLQLGQQARASAVEHWTAEVMGAKYEQLWYRLASAPSQPRIRVPSPRD
jgi:glycosyltransferase involved in cell wall biosynthesis